MAYCCVPRCNTSSRKDKNLSFHEIPVKNPLRDLWIKAIKRADWQPHTTSNYSRVCSNHFLPEDYLSDTKLRRLRPGTVPSVFKCFPEHLQITPIKKPPRGCAAIKKPQSITEKNRVELSKSLATDMDIESLVTEVDAESIVTEMETEPLHLTCEVEEKMPTSKAVQVDAQQPSFATERRQWLRKVRNLRIQAVTLQTKLDSCRSELYELKNDCYVKTLLRVMDKAADRDEAALFLLDQVNNFFSVRPVWSKSTIRNCIGLKNLSCELYECMRRGGLLKLPSASTLDKTVRARVQKRGGPVIELVETRPQLKVELQSPESPQADTSSPVDE